MRAIFLPVVVAAAIMVIAVGIPVGAIVLQDHALVPISPMAFLGGIVVGIAIGFVAGMWFGVVAERNRLTKKHVMSTSSDPASR